MDETGSRIPEEATTPYRQFNEAIHKSGEVPADKNISEVLERLNTHDPNGKCGEIFDQDGEVIGETFILESGTHSIDLRFSYPGDNREKQGLVEAIIHDTHFGVPPEFQDFHNWREVDSLEIAGTNGQKVDIFDIMPERYNIFFTDSERQHNGAVHEWYKSIYLMGGDFAAPIRLLTLLHEIGHMWDKKNVDAGRVQPIVEGRHHDLAEQLRQERAATAFVLKIVRSVTASGDQLRVDAVDDAKYHSLESYHSHFRRTIESREHMEAIGKETAKDYSEWTEQEATDCQMWAEFERWQMTDEYLEWKSSEEFRALESWDEYPAWVKWCEDNGTAWWNKTEEPKVEEKSEEPKGETK